MKIEIMTPVLKANDTLAQTNRNLFKKNNIITINLVSSPGAGKTTLLEKTIPKLKTYIKETEIAAIEGDLATSRDADRLSRFDIPTIQINTQGACHLDAAMIAGALEKLPLEELRLLFIENVGNLVCPAGFDLGENVRIVLLSISEGIDKPAKYPSIFIKADLIIINKIDLLPYCDIDLDSLIKEINQLYPHLPIICLSCKTEEGLESWINKLKEWLGI